MDDELVKLYDLLVREGYYTKTWEEFAFKYLEEPEYKEKVFDVVSRDGFYTKSKEEFLNQYKFPEPTVKKKDDAIPSVSLDGDSTYTEQPEDAFFPQDTVDSEAINDYSLDFSKQQNIIRSQEDVEKASNIFNEETKKYKEDIDSWTVRAQEIKAEYNDKFGGLTEEQINIDPSLRLEYNEFKERDIALQQEYADLVEREKYFKEQGARLDKMVGDFVDVQSQKGNWAGGIWNSVLSGVGSISAGQMSMLTDFMVEYFPTPAMGEKGYRETFISAAEQLGYSDLLPEGYEDMTVAEIKEQMKYSVPEEPAETTDGFGSEFGPVSFQQYGTRSAGKTLGQIIDEKAKDNAKKGVKFGEGYFRNPYSFVAANTDPEMGIVDATREGARELFGDKETTEQWRDMQKEGFWGGAILGLAESLPAMAGGAGPVGWAQRTANMYALTTDQLNQEMESNPEFDDISESEKYYITAPVGVTVAVLETYGFRNVINQKGLLNGLVARALGRSTKSTSAKTFSQFIREDVENMMARGILTVGAGGLAEFETGAAQQAAEITIKEIYNISKEKDMFQTPNTWIEFAGEVLKGGAQEAVGGFVLSTPGAVINAVNNKEMSLIDDDAFNMLKDMSTDSEFTTMYGQSLRQKVSAGEMTEAEAKQKFDEFNRIIGVTTQIPTDLNIADQKKALELLVEKQTLDEQIQGKDKNLVKDKADRIKEIDAELVNMAERRNATYLRDGKFLSREQFIEQLEAATPEEITEGAWEATNDSEVTDLLANKFSEIEQGAVVEEAPAEEAVAEEPAAEEPIAVEPAVEEVVVEEAPVTAEEVISGEAPIAEAPTEFSAEDQAAISDINTEIRELSRQFGVAETVEEKQEARSKLVDARNRKAAIESKYLEDVSQEEAGVPSPVEEGQAVVEGEPIEEAGVEEVAADRDVQAPEEVTAEEAVTEEAAVVEEAVAEEPTTERRRFPEEEITYATEEEAMAAAEALQERLSVEDPSLLVLSTETTGRRGKKTYGVEVMVDQAVVEEAAVAEEPVVTEAPSADRQQLETSSVDAVNLSDKAPKMIEGFNKAIKSIGGKPVSVYVVSNSDMQKLTGSSSRAQFRTLDDGSSAIIVNADKASLGSLSHEMMHAYVKAVNLSPKQIIRFTNEIRSQLSKGNAQEKRLARDLTEFQKEYLRREVYGKGLTLDDAIIAEEFLAEFVAKIKDGINVESMSLSTIERIRKAVVRILNDILGLKIDDTAIKSKEEAFDFINGFLDALEGRVEPVKSQPVSKAAKVKGQTREQIEAIKIISDDTPKQKAKKDAVAEVLNGFAEDKLEPNSSEEDLISRFLNNIFEESLYTLKKGPRESGMTWYIEDITEFENKMTVLLPELADPNQMKLFKQVLAITSSGTNPNQNLQTAYTLWVRSNGDAVNFAKNWGEDKISFITKKGVAIGTGVIVRETKTKYIVQKVDALGNPEVFKDGTPKLFEAKKSNLKEGYPKPAGFTARGNIVAQQLTKIEKVYEAVGKDINKLIEFFEKPQPVSELRKYNKGVPDADGNVRKVAVGKRNGAFIFGEKIGAFYQNMIGIGDTITMDLWWSRTWNRYMGTMLSTVDGKQVIQETPRTDRERDVMRKAVTLAAKKLNLDVSELQAVIWYFEQELWTKAGNVSPSFSYVTAVEALNSKIKTDEQTQKRFSEAGADLTAAEKRRQDAIVRADNIIAQGGIQGAVKEQIDFEGSEMINEFSWSEEVVDPKTGKLKTINRTEKSDKPIGIKFPDGTVALVRSFDTDLKEAQQLLKKVKSGVYPYMDEDQVESKIDLIKKRIKRNDVVVELIDGDMKYHKPAKYGRSAKPMGSIELSNNHYNYYFPRVAKMLGKDHKAGLMYSPDNTRGSSAVEIYEEFQGKGFGSRLYFAALRLLREQVPGARLISNHDINVSRKAKNFWRSQVNNGLAKVILNTSTKEEIEKLGGPEVLKQLKDIGAEYTGDIYELLDPSDRTAPSEQYDVVSEDVARQQIDWQASLFGKGQVNPAIVNRSTPVQEAALDLLQGKISNAEYQETVRITQPVEPITRFFLPASTKDMREALDSNKGKILNTAIEDGKEVGLRLDIPAYKNRNIWVVSVHDSGKAGKSISYGSVAWATDVQFGSNPKVAAFIAAGKNIDTGKKQDKTTIARMHGKWKNFDGKTKEERDASAVEKVEEIVAIESSYPGAARKGSPWRQIGMNPFRHSYFYDRRTGKPVVAASEVVQIGGLVYAKDVVYADKNDPVFEVQGYKDSKGETVRFQIEDQVNQEKNSEETYSAIQDNKEGVFRSQIDNKVDQDVAASDIWNSRKRNVFERFVDLTRRKIQDSYRDIIIVQEDIEYATGKPVGLDQDFRNAEVLMHGEAKNELNKTENRIKDIAGKIKKSGLSVDDVNELLYAMHAQERNRYLRTISTDIGKSLSEMRKKNGMTPTEVAELLGVSKEQYLEIEANKRDLKSSDLTDLLLIYGSTPYRFFYDNALVKDGSGMTDVEARKILAKYDLNLTSPDVSQLSPKIRPAVTAIRELIADTRNRLVESGLESQGTIDAFNATYKNYVPLRGFADEQFGSEIIEGGSKLEVRARERRAKGRQRKADSPLTQAIISNTTTIIRGAKNDVMRRFYELAKNNPNKDIYEIVDPETSKDYKTSFRDGKVIAVAKSVSDYLLDEKMVSVRIDGDYKFIRFKDAKLANALRGANIVKAQWFTKYIGAFNRFQSALITTYDPDFVFRNFSRDIQTAVLNLYAEQDLNDGLIKDKNIVGKTIKDVYPALKTIFAVEGGWTGKKEASRNKDMDQYYKEFLEDGAKTEWFYSKPADQINKDIEKLISGKGDGAIKAAANLVERVNSSVENAVRLSAYVNARKAGTPRAKAAELAKNLTVNFNKSGEWGQIGNTLYLFFNASVQGSSRLLRSLKPAYKIDSEGNRKYHLTRAQKMAVGLYIMGSVMSVFNEWMSDEDEDGESFFSKIPEFEKERNIIIMKPNGKNYWKIPLPYGSNVFYVAGSYTSEGLNGTKTPGEVAAAIGQTAIGSFSPINFPTSKDASSFFIKFIMPTATQVPIAIGLNEDYFGRKIYNENFIYDPAPKPESQLGKESGYRWTQSLAKWLNEVTGGSAYRSGYIDVNPDKVDFVVETLTGGSGKFVTRSANVIDKILTGNWDELEARHIPFVRTFNGQPYKYSNINSFYERTVDVNQKFKEVEAGVIKGADAKKIYKMHKMGKDYKSRLKKISKLEDEAAGIKDPLKQEARLDQLEKARYKLVADFNKQYIQLKIEDI